MTSIAPASALGSNSRFDEANRAAPKVRRHDARRLRAFAVTG